MKKLINFFKNLFKSFKKEKKEPCTCGEFCTCGKCPRCTPEEKNPEIIPVLSFESEIKIVPTSGSDIWDSEIREVPKKEKKKRGRKPGKVKDEKVKEKKKSGRKKKKDESN